VGCWTPESEVADILRQVEQAHPNCQIGSYPFFREGRVGANFVMRSTGAAELKSCVDSLCDGLATAGFDFTPGGI
ncbi:MAG: competence/damage-inducible protein A, partial [Erythrobacter sp.]